MSMSPFSLGALAGDAAPSMLRYPVLFGMDLPEMPTVSSRSARPRPSKRSQYANAAQTSCSLSNDDPPSYHEATRRPWMSSTRPDEGAERLPLYSCPVTAGARMLVNVESINPLHVAMESGWREIYVVLCGTMLNFHRIKDGGAGKLIRSYTLQHAEIGLAIDTEHAVLVPRSRLARLVPAAARRKAWQKDPDLFDSVSQTIVRLRLETDQVLLADSDEDLVHSLILDICAAIDIAPAIDERNLPRQCTLPRRRRRQRPDLNGNLNDPVLLREQERIMRERYPGLLANPTTSAPLSSTVRPVFPRTNTADSQSDGASPAREDDELDLSMIRDDSAETRPITARANRSSRWHSATLSGRPATATAATNNNDDNDDDDDELPERINSKWQPVQPLRPASHHQRYLRRCLPTLPAGAPRASDVLICNAHRVRINWRMELLEPWELKPPSYRHHHHHHHHQPQPSPAPPASSDPSVVSGPRPVSLSSATSADDAGPTIATPTPDRITPMSEDEPALGARDLALTKMVSAASALAEVKGSGGRRKSTLCDARPTIQRDVQGFVFCF